MEKGIAKLRQQNNEHREDVIKKAEVIDRALSLLPDIPVSHIYVPDHRGNVWIEIEVEQRAEALALMDILKPVPVVIHKDVCTSILPLKQLTDKMREQGTYFEIEPFYLWQAEYRSWNHKTDISMWWFCEIEELMFKVKCPILKDPGRIWEKIERNSRQEIISRKWQFDNFPSADWLQFYSVDPPGDKVLYNVRKI